MPIVAGKNGNGFFSFRGKQSFRREFFLELLERQIERALPLRLHIVDIKLQVAAHRIKAHLAETEDRQAVFREEAQAPSLAAKHYRADLALVVFEGEVIVPRGRHTKVGDLALHPERVEARFQSPFDELVELGDAQEFPRRGGKQR